MLTPLPVTEVFTTQECTDIIRMVQARSLTQAGLVGGDRHADIRRTQIAWLDDQGDAAWVFHRLVDTVITSNRDHFCFDLTEFSERMQIARYDASESGHFDWHVDVGEGALAAKRKLTFVVQLSPDTDYEGGDLECNGCGGLHSASRDQGKGLLFPSFALHRVTPVTRGHRFSLTTWIHGPAFR